VRKVYYNITITGLSVGVALLVGSIEILGLLAGRLGWSGGLWDWVSGIDLNTVGFFIVAMFVVTWGVALAVWRLGRIEERWARSLLSDPATVHDAELIGLAQGDAHQLDKVLELGGDGGDVRVTRP
jgi:hypothetical protein